MSRSFGKLSAGKYRAFAFLAAACLGSLLQSAPVLAEPVDAVLIYVAEQDAEDGNVNPVSVSAGFSLRYELADVSFSLPFENWKAGEEIGICAVFRAKEGYEFTDATDFRSYYMELRSQEGDASVRRVWYGYKPKMTLKAPEDIGYDEEDRVKWDKVAGAKRYLVKIYEDDELVKVLRTKQRSADISEYGADGQSVSVSVYALSSNADDDSIMESVEISLDDSVVHGSNTVYGSFRKAGGHKYFLQEDGGKAYGWQFINGSWYYFDPKSGYARTGWLQDTDGHWYYLRSNGKMATGLIDDGGYSYYLQADEGAPYGAMVTGEYHFGPGSVTMIFNDGRDPSVPLGARIQ